MRRFGNIDLQAELCPIYDDGLLCQTVPQETTRSSSIQFSTPGQ